jgi:hypothetical protein
MVLCIYTYYTDEKKAEQLLKSSQIHGLPIKNLSRTTEWKGLEDKLHGIKEELKTTDPNDIICFIDAYDVIVNCDENKLLRVFEESKSRIFFGAEIDLDPPVFDRNLFPTSPLGNQESNPRFLNSGVYIGYSSEIQKMLNTEEYTGKNDQEYCNGYFLENRITASIKLDYTNELVLNMFKVNWSHLSIQNGNVSYELNGAMPCFIHFNGCSYQNIEHELPKEGSPYLSDKLLETITKAKHLSKHHNVLVYLTGRGHTYRL